MARMKTSRLITAVAVFVLAGNPANAQFKRGLGSATTTISLFPVVPPAVLLPAGSFDVAVRNRSTAPDHVASGLRDAIAKEMSENDRRLEAVEHTAQMHVVATIVDWAHTRRHGKRYVPEVRQVGIQNVASGEGNTYTEPMIDYGRDKPNVVDKGTAAIRVEVRRPGAHHQQQCRLHPTKGAAAEGVKQSEQGGSGDPPLRLTA